MLLGLTGGRHAVAYHNGMPLSSRYSAIMPSGDVTVTPQLASIFRKCRWGATPCQLVEQLNSWISSSRSLTAARRAPGRDDRLHGTYFWNSHFRRITRTLNPSNLWAAMFSSVILRIGFAGAFAFLVFTQGSAGFRVAAKNDTKFCYFCCNPHTIIKLCKNKMSLQIFLRDAAHDAVEHGCPI